MTLTSTAQELFVIEENELVPHNNQVVLEPINLSPSHSFMDMEVSESLEDMPTEMPEAEQFIIVIDDIPGAPKGTELPDIEVVDEEEKSKEDEDKLDMQLAPKGKWDWTYTQPEQFMKWVQDRINEVPNHSGYDTAGIERAISYLQRIDDEVSKAMRNDIEGMLDANLIEKTRAQIDSGVDKLSKRRDDIKNSKKKLKKKKADVDLENGLSKEAKSAGIGNIMITVPLLISTIARVCINSTVSAGKDLEQVFKDQCEKYSLTEREKTELRQLLDDMGFPLFYDRGHGVDDTYSMNDNTNYDWNQNFTG